jgi:hypothetical protein
MMSNDSASRNRTVTKSPCQTMRKHLLTSEIDLSISMWKTEAIELKTPIVRGPSLSQKTLMAPSEIRVLCHVGSAISRSYAGIFTVFPEVRA